MMLTSCLICFYRACYKLRLHVSSWRWVTSNWKSELNSIPQSTQMLPRVICSPVNSVSTICNGWTLTLQSLVHVREKVVYRNGYMKFILTLGYHISMVLHVILIENLLVVQVATLERLRILLLYLRHEKCWIMRFYQKYRQQLECGHIVWHYIHLHVSVLVVVQCFPFLGYYKL